MASTYTSIFVVVAVVADGVINSVQYKCIYVYIVAIGQQLYILITNDSSSAVGGLDDRPTYRGVDNRFPWEESP